MIKRSVRIRLVDIMGAIDDAAEILDGADFAAYQQSVTMRRGIERCVEIVSEASRYIPDELTARESGIPWREVRAIGNRLRHEYQRLEDLVIWRIASRSLPELKQAVQRLLAAIDKDDTS